MNKVLRRDISHPTLVITSWNAQLLVLDHVTEGHPVRTHRSHNTHRFNIVLGGHGVAKSETEGKLAGNWTGKLEWDALVRRLEREDPSYRE